jgi:hypothetical protein
MAGIADVTGVKASVAQSLNRVLGLATVFKHSDYGGTLHVSHL